MPVKGRVLAFRRGGSLYRLAENILTGISLERYGRLCLTVVNWRGNVKRLTAAKGWNQRQLAEAAGLRENTLSDAIGLKEDGTPKRQPGADTLEAIADGLGVPMWALFVTEREYALFTAHVEKADADAEEQKRREAVRQTVQAELAPMVEAIVAKLTGQSVGPSAAKTLAEPRPVAVEKPPVKKRRAR